MNRVLIALALALALAGASALQAAERVVFISAFAPADKGGIYAYLLDDSGKLAPLERNHALNPFYMALSTDERFLYSIHAKQFGGKDHEEVTASEILAEGKLKTLNRQSARGSAACYLDVDASGKAVLVANYTTGSVAALPVKPDGSLDEGGDFVQHTGSSVNPSRQKEPHAHCFVVSPDNRFALAADLGLDKILVYKLEAATAKLLPHDPPFANSPAGAGPRHLTFHPGGKHVYVINEISNSITCFDWDAKGGKLAELQTLTTLPEGFAGKSYCADLKTTPDGRFLYGTNRGHDSIACYRLADDGRMTLLHIEPSLGKGPQNLAITNDGKLLLCANMPGNNVAVFRIDRETGRLVAAIGTPISLPSPSCIQILSK